MKVIANHAIDPRIKLEPNAGSDRSWVWSAFDFAEGELVETVFALRFADSEIAEKFKTAFEDAQKEMESVLAGEDKPGEDGGAAADEAAERKLAAKAKTIAEARDAGLLAVGLSTGADQCGPWLFLWAKVTNYVMNRTTALSSVMVETGEGKPLLPSTCWRPVTWWKDVRFGFGFGFAGSNQCERNFLQECPFSALAGFLVLDFAAPRSRRSPYGVGCVSSGTCLRECSATCWCVVASRWRSGC